MVNAAHLKILQAGTEAWNQRRKVKYVPDFRDLAFKDPKKEARRHPDLSGWNGAFLRSFDLDRMIQREVPHPGEMNDLVEKISEGKLTMDEQKLGWRTLDDYNLNNVDLAQVDLSNISFRKASLIRANLVGANLISADLSWTTLSGANLTGARMELADLTGANLRERRSIKSI